MGEEISEQIFKITGDENAAKNELEPGHLKESNQIIAGGMLIQLMLK